MASEFSISLDSNMKEKNMTGIFRTDAGKKFSIFRSTTLTIDIGGVTRTRDTSSEISDIETYGNFVKLITKGASKSIGSWLFENIDDDLDDVIVTLLLDKFKKWRVFYNGIQSPVAFNEDLTLGCLLKTSEGWRDTPLYGVYMESLRNNEKLKEVHEKYETAGSLIVIHFDYERKLDLVCVVSTNGTDLNLNALQLTAACQVSIGSAVIGLLISIARNAGYKQITFVKNDIDKQYLDSVTLQDDPKDDSILHIPTEGAGTIKSALFYDVSVDVIKPYEKIELFTNDDGTYEEIFPVDWDAVADLGQVVTVTEGWEVYPRLDGGIYTFPLNKPIKSEFPFMGLPPGTAIRAAAHNRSQLLFAIISLPETPGLRLVATWDGSLDFVPKIIEDEIVRRMMVKLPDAQKIAMAAWKGNVAIILDDELYYIDVNDFYYQGGEGVKPAVINVTNIDHDSKHGKVGILSDKKIWIRVTGDEIAYYNVSRRFNTRSVWMPQLWGPTQSHAY